MSDSSILENTVVRKCNTAVPEETLPVTRLEVRIKSWYIDVLVIVVGLATLCFFLATGGVFAIIGPWVILMNTISIRKHSSYPGFIAGGILLFLNIAGLLPTQAWSWGNMCGILGLVGELAILTVIFLEMRKLPG